MKLQNRKSVLQTEKTLNKTRMKVKKELVTATAAVTYAHSHCIINQI